MASLRGENRHEIGAILGLGRSSKSVDDDLEVVRTRTKAQTNLLTKVNASVVGLLSDMDYIHPQLRNCKALSLDTRRITAGVRDTVAASVVPTINITANMVAELDQKSEEMDGKLDDALAMLGELEGVQDDVNNTNDLLTRLSTTIDATRNQVGELFMDRRRVHASLADIQNRFAAAEAQRATDHQLVMQKLDQLLQRG